MRVQWAIDMCFLIDIILQLRTTTFGRAEEGSVVITDTRILMRGYTRFPYLHRGRFLWDVISCIPIDLIGLVPGLLPGGIYGVYAMWLRTNRLIHGLRVISVHGGQIAKLTRPRKIYTYGVSWFFLAHLTACCYWAIGVAPFNRPAAEYANTLIWYASAEQPSSSSSAAEHPKKHLQPTSTNPH